MRRGRVGGRKKLRGLYNEEGAAFDGGGEVLMRGRGICRVAAAEGRDKLQRCERWLRDRRAHSSLYPGIFTMCCDVCLTLFVTSA